MAYIDCARIPRYGSHDVPLRLADRINRFEILNLQFIPGDGGRHRRGEVSDDAQYERWECGGDCEARGSAAGDSSQILSAVIFLYPPHSRRRRLASTSTRSLRRRECWKSEVKAVVIDFVSCIPPPPLCRCSASRRSLACCARNSRTRLSGPPARCARQRERKQLDRNHSSTRIASPWPSPCPYSPSGFRSRRRSRMR